MGKRVNRYRLKTEGLKIEKSIHVSYCEGKTDKEIAELILRLSEFYNTAESLAAGRREFELKQIR